jgi:hypothetical protein
MYKFKQPRLQKRPCDQCCTVAAGSPYPSEQKCKQHTVSNSLKRWTQYLAKCAHSLWNLKCASSLPSPQKRVILVKESRTGHGHCERWGWIQNKAFSDSMWQSKPFKWHLAASRFPWGAMPWHAIRLCHALPHLETCWAQRTQWPAGWE